MIKQCLKVNVWFRANCFIEIKESWKKFENNFLICFAHFETFSQFHLEFVKSKSFELKKLCQMNDYPAVQTTNSCVMPLLITNKIYLRNHNQFYPFMDNPPLCRNQKKALMVSRSWDSICRLQQGSRSPNIPIVNSTAKICKRNGLQQVNGNEKRTQRDSKSERWVNWNFHFKSVLCLKIIVSMSWLMLLLVLAII